MKKEKPELNIWCYSGYTFEELKNRKDEITDITLNNIDVLVDGQFKTELFNPTLKYKGSSNQRVIDVQKSLREQKPILMNLA